MYCILMINLVESMSEVFGVPDGNRTHVAAATERSFATKLQAPYHLTLYRIIKACPTCACVLIVLLFHLLRV